MKLGNVKCKDMLCKNCPFCWQHHFVSICTSLKLNEKLSKGLKYAKSHFPAPVYKRLEKALNKEYRE